jgi:hypothetical protein
LSVDSTVVPWTTGLRIRNNPEPSANVLGFLGLWEKLTVLELRNEQVIINGNTGNWVKVRRENSQTSGWCFSYFLEEIDVNNFFPVLEYRGFAHYIGGTGGGSREIYTLYNSGRRREKLILNYNNKVIDIYNNVTVSDNGRVMAFNWIDPSTIKRNSRDGTMSGTKYLFVYNFTNHNLRKIDEISITQSDVNSQRWANDRWYEGEGEYAEGFYIDTSIEWFILNANGTKLFYGKDYFGIEVDLITGNMVNHQINREAYHIGRYVGKYIYLGPYDDNDGFLYDPAQKKRLTSVRLYSRGNRHEGVYYCYPVILSKNRYLIIEQEEINSSGIIIHDLTTNQQQRFNKIELSHNSNDFDGGIYHSKYYDEDYYYIVTSLYRRSTSNRTIEIRKVDYNNNIISQHAFNNITGRMRSYSETTVIHNSGIINFQYGFSINKDYQAWMIIYLFNNTLLEYRLDDGTSDSGSYGFYLMNRY